MILAIEERSLNAWPAQRYLFHEGWLLGFTGGYTRRANCVNTLFVGNERAEASIALCEEQYVAHRLPTRFRITPLSKPHTLDQLLEGRGYLREAETEVLYAPVTSWRRMSETDHAARVLPRDEWLEAYWQVAGQSSEYRRWHGAIVQAIVPAVCPVVVEEQGRPAAVGLGVLDRGIVGIYDLFTDTRYRRQGRATQVLRTMLSWALDNGAYGAYLGVMSENIPALTLYTRLGFTPCYRYWYRLRDVASVEAS